MSDTAPIRTIGIISRPRRENLTAVVPGLLAWLAERGVKAEYDAETADALNDRSRMRTRAQLAAESDLLLVLGGDGTLLAAAREAAPRGVPILPINLGSLGFLTSFTVDELYPALTATLAQHLPASERILLRVELVRGGQVIAEQRVLNEAVVNKSALARMIDVELHIEDEFICRYRADGLIVATPTGSTAYSLSAGGPIVHPSVESLLITPICPHMLSDRPLVVRDFAHIRISLGQHADSVFLTLDGQKGIPMNAGDFVRIERAAERLKLIQPPSKSYFEILRNKLKWGEA
jgi:NAD+ kinase